MLRFDVGARVGLEADFFDERLFGPEETHREQNELRGADFFGARLFFRDELTFFVFLPLDLDGDDRLEIAGGVAVEFFYRREIHAGIGAEFGGGFFLAVVHLVSLGPFGPGIVGGALERGLG